MNNQGDLATTRLTRLSFYGHHGVFEDEKEIGGRYEVDCEYGVDIKKAAESDLLGDTVDYTKVYSIIEDLVTNNRFNLVETLTERIVNSLIETFGFPRLTVRVRKMNPPIEGNIESFEIEIVR
jgi:dihydroneopterin aldolase